MFEKYIGSLFTKARSKDERRFQATKRDVAKALLLFRRTIAALKRAKQAGEDGVAVVEREVGMAQLDRALPTIEAVADVADQDILLTAAEKHTPSCGASARASWQAFNSSPTSRTTQCLPPSKRSRRRTKRERGPSPSAHPPPFCPQSGAS